MKKLLAVFLTITMAIGVGAFVFACNDRTPEPTPQEYTVTFKYEDGVTPDRTVNVAAGEKVTEPVAPKRNGYVFIGWYHWAAQYNFDSAVTGNLTLTAHWAEDVDTDKCKVSFEPIDGAEYKFERLLAPASVDVGSTVEFEIEVSPYYTVAESGITVRANGNVITPQEGLYSLKVESDTAFTVSGVEKDDAPMPGLGTALHPFEISSPSQWIEFVTKANAAGNYSAKNYKLTADLDFKGLTIPSVTYFSGKLDGQGHTVKNYKISRVETLSDEQLNDDYLDSSNVGLFGRVVLAEIKNLNLENFNVSVSSNAFVYAGGLAGDVVSSDILGVTARGSIDYTATGSYYFNVGGIAGVARTVSAYPGVSATVLQCYTDVAIHSDYMAFAGGIVGRTGATEANSPVVIANCAAVGNIDGGHYSGGIAGMLGSYSSVANCYSTGIVLAASEFEGDLSIAGGLVGLIDNYESVIINSVTSSYASVAASEAGEKHSGSIYGHMARGSVEIDKFAAPSYLKDNYYAPGGYLSAGGHTFDLTDKATLLALTGWNENKWDFTQGGFPLPKEYSADRYNVTFELYFPGETFFIIGDSITGLGTKYVDECCMENKGGSFVPLYWAFGNGFMFASETGHVSAGIYDGEGRQLPSAYPITDNDTEKTIIDEDSKKGYDAILAYADYDAQKGNIYYFTNGGVNYSFTLNGINDDGDAILTLRSGNEKFDFEYLCYGEVTTGGNSYNELVLFDAPYSIFGDAGDVALYVTDTTVSYRTSSGMVVLARTSDGSTPTTDAFVGNYESDVYRGISVAFDGHGSDYTVEGDIATKNGNTYRFNADGYLVMTTANGDSCILGKAGGMAGIWSTDGYTLELDGISKDGLGYGRDSFGNELIYIPVSGNGMSGFEFYSGSTFVGMAVVRRSANALDYRIVLEMSFASGVREYDLGLSDKVTGNWYDADKNALVLENRKAYVGSDKTYVPYTYVSDSAVTFSYDGHNYRVELTDSDTLGVSVDGAAAVQYKQYDFYYKNALMNSDGSLTYTFNGMGELGKGIVTVSEDGMESEYAYTVNTSGDAEIYDGEVLTAVVSYNASRSIYRLTRSGTTVDLGVLNPYTGTWAVRGFNGNTLTVGLLDATGITTGKGIQVSSSGQLSSSNVIWRRDEATGNLNMFSMSNAFLGNYIHIGRNGNLEFFDGSDERSLETPDEFMGAYASSDGQFLMFDGVGMTGSVYYGFAIYGFNNTAQLGLYYTRATYNGRVVALANVYDAKVGSMRNYCVFEAVSASDVDEVAQIYRSYGVSTTVFVNSSDETRCVIYASLYADELALLENATDMSGRKYTFFSSMQYDCQYAKSDESGTKYSIWGYNYVTMLAGNSSSTYAYALDYYEHDEETGADVYTLSLYLPADIADFMKDTRTFSPPEPYSVATVTVIDGAAMVNVVINV